MQFSATSKYIRVSTRKVRLMADSIRSATPKNALEVLSVLPHSASVPLYKTISSAVANAKEKNVDIDSLRFKNIEIMGAGAMKRWRAVSRGSAHTYKKRMTHIRIIVETIAEDKK